MSPSDTTKETPVVGFYGINWIASDCMPRDREQSHRLHEPDMMITSIDPVTGQDIDDLYGRPYIVDGNLTIYFESEDTRQAYRDTPTDHPFHLQDNPTEDGEAEG